MDVSHWIFPFLVRLHNGCWLPEVESNYDVSSPKCGEAKYAGLTKFLIPYICTYDAYYIYIYCITYLLSWYILCVCILYHIFIIIYTMPNFDVLLMFVPTSSTCTVWNNIFLKQAPWAIIRKVHNSNIIVPPMPMHYRRMPDKAAYYDVTQTCWRT